MIHCLKDVDLHRPFFGSLGDIYVELLSVAHV